MTRLHRRKCGCGEDDLCSRKDTLQMQAVHRQQDDDMFTGDAAYSPSQLY